MNKLFSPFIFVFSCIIFFAFNSNAQNINGTWHFDYGYDMTFSGSGGSFTGSGAGSGYTWSVTNGTISGSSVSWHESYDQINYTVDRTGTISGDSMSGTLTTNAGQNLSWSATRISGGGPVTTPTPNATPPSGGKRPTKITLFCNRTGVLLETADCVATVADAGPQPVSLPTGTISFQATNGFFPATGSCFPTQTQFSPGIGSCKAIFQIPNGFPLGAKFPIDAVYNGDTNFDSSSTSHQLIVASCVGTPENPCKNSIGLDFTEVPEVIQNKIDALILCGGDVKNKSSVILRNIAARKKVDQVAVQCVIDAYAEFEVAEVLVGLSPNQFRFVATKITSAQANASPMLKNFRTLATTSSDEQLIKLLDPNAPGNVNKRYIIDALKSGTLPRGVRSMRLRAKSKPQGNAFVKIGTVKATVKSGTQKEVKFKLSKEAKAVVAVFKSANINSLPMKITVKGTRGNSKKVKTIKGSTDVGLN